MHGCVGNYWRAGLILWRVGICGPDALVPQLAARIQGLAVDARGVWFDAGCRRIDGVMGGVGAYASCCC